MADDFATVVVVVVTTELSWKTEGSTNDVEFESSPKPIPRTLGGPAPAPCSSKPAKSLSIAQMPLLALLGLGMRDCGGD